MEDIRIEKSKVPYDLQKYFESAFCSSCYICHLILIFRAVRRVLKPWGTCWVNIGDSYAGSGKSSGQEEWLGGDKQKTNMGSLVTARTPVPNGLKPLDLCGIPESLVLALRADGWYWRSTIIWAKTNPMPESVAGWRWEKHKVKVGAQTIGTSPQRIGSVTGTGQRPQRNAPGGVFEGDAIWQDCPGCPVCQPNDGLVLRKGAGRCTSSYEYVIMLAKSASYYSDFEAVREPTRNEEMQTLWATSSFDNVLQEQSKEGWQNGELWPMPENNPQGTRIRPEILSNRKIQDTAKEICSIGKGTKNTESLRLGISATSRESGTPKRMAKKSKSESETQNKQSQIFNDLERKNLQEEQRPQIQALTEGLNNSHALQHQTTPIETGRSYFDVDGMEGYSETAQEQVLLLPPETGEINSGSFDTSEQRREPHEGQCGPSLPQMQSPQSRPSSTSHSSRNLRDVWTINTQPFPGAHFATFPEELVKKPILASTSEKGNCPKCGMPWVRVIQQEKRNVRPHHLYSGKSFDATHTDLGKEVKPSAGFSRTGEQFEWATETLSWRPSCSCGIAETVPAVIVDPFAGSGTSLSVAKRLGRRSIGVDLSASYCKMAKRRVEAETAPFREQP